jgi:hypothetical protein
MTGASPHTNLRSTGFNRRMIKGVANPDLVL